MSSVMKIVQRASIGGYVRDALSGMGIADAEVTIAGTEYVARTDAEGFYRFVNLALGSYTLDAHAPALHSCYGQGSVRDVRVDLDAAGRPRLDVRANLTLAPTALSGRVCRTDGSGIARAQVWLRALNLKTLADGAGEYVLAAIQAGPQTVQVTAPGFGLLQQRVQLRAGETKIQNFTLNVS